MIHRDTGALALGDAHVLPGTTEPEALALGWKPLGPGLLARETDDTRGRALLVTLRFASGLRGLELRYAVRRPVEDGNGIPDWELARKDFHDAIVREWFASSVHDLMYAPPPQPGPLTFRFPWGEVRSDRTDGRGATIEVRLAEAAH